MVNLSVGVGLSQIGTILPKLLEELVAQYLIICCWRMQWEWTELTWQELAPFTLNLLAFFISIATVPLSSELQFRIRYECYSREVALVKMRLDDSDVEVPRMLI